jgi:ATP-dependent DNA helicase RecQ
VTPTPATAAAADAAAVSPALAEEAAVLLARLVGDPSAAFRDGQLQSVAALVEGGERVLVVQRTGWGKSAVYFVATALVRARGGGPTLIVSPLLALMRDQVDAARRAGLRAVTMNSANADEWAEVTAGLAADEVDLLLVSPERLNNPRFRDEQLPRLAAATGLLVVDEAHCISDWGHDFRPDYRRIRDLLAELPAGRPVLATTATANARVVDDVVEQLGAGGAPVRAVRGSLARDSLRLGVLALPTADARLGWLAARLAELPGSGIVYALTVSAAEDTAALLREAGHEVRAYTGRTDPADRLQLERALRDNEVKALVATSALGMGFDKPDLGFVVHVGAPASPVAYYQQVGRAGRATERADVLLLPASEDREIWRYFATASMPRRVDADAVLAALAESSPKPMSTAALETVADVRRTRLELLLKVLDVEGAVQRVSGGWVSTGAGWTYDEERYTRVAAARDSEAASMLDYQRAEGCRMRFLQEALDDPGAADCGRCDRCAGAWYDPTVPDGAVQAATRTLRKVGVPLEPRSQWPSGMSRLDVAVTGRIGPDERLDEGRVVARLTDLGWGQRLRSLLAAGAPDAPADDRLLAACVEVLAGWGWADRPVAVAAVPSLGRPQLVASVARHLAALGRLEDLGSLDLTTREPTGGPGGNSAFRLAAVHHRFAVPAATAVRLPELAGPVLLVDDLVDSRWTMTVAGALLRRAGAPAVLPFALAAAG